MAGCIEAIYVAPSAGVPMRECNQVEAVADCGLRDDRYCERTGYYTQIDECQVTLIEAEDLEDSESRYGVRMSSGEHRRNLVTRGLELSELSGKRFRIGEVLLEYDRSRPPCSYLESLTQPGMLRALLGRGGICARVIQSGVIRVGDEITVL